MTPFIILAAIAAWFVAAFASVYFPMKIVDRFIRDAATGRK